MSPTRKGRRRTAASRRPPPRAGVATAKRPSPAGGPAPAEGPSRPAAFRAKQTRVTEQRKWLLRAGALAAGVMIAVLFVALRNSSRSSSIGGNDVAAATLTGPQGPEGVALETGTVLAPADTAATGQTVDGVACLPTEQISYHIHSHLAVYVDGVLRPIPAGIGTVSPVVQQTANGPFAGASRCYYWLHVHAQDGIIHIESPTQRSYTLGQFFDIWNQPLSQNQVGPAGGDLTVYVNGRPFPGDPRTIVLGSREDIQIDVGTPAVPPHKLKWSPSQL